MLTTRHLYLDTVERIRARDCPVGALYWLGVDLQVSERVYGVRRHRRLLCPVCMNPNQAILYALPKPVCKRCAQAAGAMYSYQAKSPKREAATVLSSRIRFAVTPTAKRLALAAALEAQSAAMSLDVAKLDVLARKAAKT